MLSLWLPDSTASHLAIPALPIPSAKSNHTLNLAPGDFMPDESQTPTADKKEAIGTNGVDGDEGISKWIKNLGALVGVFAAVAGIWVSVQGLRDKAIAEENTAKATLEDERVKLEIAREQSAQHKADIDLEIQKHVADLKHQESQTAADQTRMRHDTLAALITHMFSSQGSSEGDIAVLFDHVNHGEDSIDIIENAVLARLEAPRSKEEIELGLRLLERVGSGALDVVIEANRSARARYDDCLVARYTQAYNERMSRAAEPGVRLDHRAIKDDIENEISRFSFLDKDYDFATINSKTGILISGSYPVRKLNTTDVVATQELAAAVIERSNAILLMMLKNQNKTPLHRVALSNTYLAGTDWAFTKDNDVDLSDAYIDWDSSNYAEMEHHHLAFNFSAKQCFIVVHRGMYNSDYDFDRPVL
jgi:hypothetical protein